MHHSASKLILIIINIFVDVKNKELLLHFISVTAKSSEKMIGDKYMKKFHKLEGVYRDCIKRTRDKTRPESIIQALIMTLLSTIS